MQFITQPMPMSPEVIDDRVASVLEAGTNVTLDYDDASNTLTINATPGGGSSYTDEQAQDAVGSILQDSATIDYVYNDATPYITGLVKDNSITEAMLSFTDSTTQNATTVRHGLLPKLSGVSTEFLTGTGVFTTGPVGPQGIPGPTGPPGPGTTPEEVQDVIASTLVAGTNVTLNYNDTANILTINAASGGGGTPTTFRGCVVTRSASLTGIDARFGYAIPWDAEQYDTNTMHDTVSNNTRITVPSGVTRVCLTAGAHLSGAAVAGFAMYIVKNSTINVAGINYNVGSYPDPATNLVTPIIDVVPGDYFQAMIYYSLTSVTIQATPATFFACEIVEPLMIAGADVETIQDTVGAMLIDSSSIDFTYNDAAGTITASVTPTLGTMAQQNANAVAITDGHISVGGHALTGVLDVQGSVQASDVANRYISVRAWPVAPAGATQVNGVRIDPVTGAAATTSALFGFIIADQPTTSEQVAGMYSAISAGTARYNMFAQGTAQNYFAGNVGIANSAPSYPLDVTGNARVTGTVFAPQKIVVGASTSVFSNRIEIVWIKSAEDGIVLKTTTDTGAFATLGFLNAAGVQVGSISQTSSATAYNTSSDVRLKNSIEKLVGALDKIQLLNPVKFFWNADDSPGEGFLAHELQQVIPAAVTGEPDALNDDGSIRPQQVDHSKLIPWLVSAVQELAAKVAQLEAQLGV